MDLNNWDNSVSVTLTFRNPKSVNFATVYQQPSGNYCVNFFMELNGKTHKPYLTYRTRVFNRAVAQAKLHVKEGLPKNVQEREADQSSS